MTMAKTPCRSNTRACMRIDAELWRWGRGPGGSASVSKGAGREGGGGVAAFVRMNVLLVSIRARFPGLRWKEARCRA